jgi:hypothetical protein
MFATAGSAVLPVSKVTTLAPGKKSDGWIAKTAASEVEQVRLAIAIIA